MDKRVKIRPIEGRDIAAFFPFGMRDTCVGWAVDLDGELACIAGVSRGRSLMVAFSKVKPGLNATKRMVWETALVLDTLIKNLPYKEIWALTVKGRFLQALGWEYQETRGPVEVFKWTR